MVTVLGNFISKSWSDPMSIPKTAKIAYLCRIQSCVNLQLGRLKSGAAWNQDMLRLSDASGGFQLQGRFNRDPNIT